jgi:hypothetical protein
MGEGWGEGSAARYAWLLTRPVADLSTRRGEITDALE